MTVSHVPRRLGRSLLLLLAAACGLNLLSMAAAAAEPQNPTELNLRRGQLNNVSFDDRGRLRLERVDDGYVSEGAWTSEPGELGQAGVISLDWIAQWTAPQRWKKHSGNPIYGPKQSGEWDTWTNGVSVVRTPDGQGYKMFYSGRKGAGIGFAEASIDDPLTWKEHPASPVLKPRDNWEGNLLNQPRVVKVTDTHWRMYYTGWGLKEPGTPWAMGLAESHDAGVTWKRVGDDPLIPRGGPDSPDGAGVFVPTVLRVGEKWMMWYTATKLAPGKQHIHLCLATSDDGVHWEKYENNPVVSEDFGDRQRVVHSRCCVRHDDGVFRMWFSYGNPRYRIHYAESLDGKHWERGPIAPVLGPSKEGWDSQIVEYPEVDIVNETYRMWFCGNGYGTVGYAEGIVETQVSVSIRSGDTPQPDDGWGKWRALERNARQPVGRYVQVRAELSSKNRQLSPALNAMTVSAAN